MLISIHAPTRGATIKRVTLIVIILFQSTLPREERLAFWLLHNKNIVNFNPRSHERSDKPRTKTEKRVNISIHAPTRGATISQIIVKFFTLISIHAPTRGATGSSGRPALAARFQSTLPREERLGSSPKKEI